VWGNTTAGSIIDILQLGGTGTGTFNLSSIGVQYEDFATFNEVGSATWIVTGTGAEVWHIESGTFQLGNGGATGSASLIAPIVDDSIFAIDLSGTYTYGYLISGTGVFEQDGTGTTILTDAETNTGGATIQAGTLELGSGGSITGNVTFAGPATELILMTGPSQISGDIMGAIGGDKIDVRYVPFAAGVTAVWTQMGSTGTLSLVNGATTLTSLTLSGTYVTADFTALSDGSGGTLIDVSTPPPPPATTVNMILVDYSNNGASQIYNIGNNAILASYPLGQIGTSSTVVGVDGFNDSDTSDMLLRNSSTGAFTVYDVSGNTVTAGPVSMGAVGLEWQVSGFGNFSSNPGETDMLMQNSSGAFEVFDIANNQITNAVPLGAVGAPWQVAGFGGFSGNANETDMLMRNSNTGVFDIFDISKNTIAFAGSFGPVGLEWTVAGIGDFSSNPGESDMLMRNSGTGAFAYYDISDNQLTAAGLLGGPSVGLAWQAVGFANFSGNANETDMLLRNSSGAFEVADISHNAITSIIPIGTVGPEWTVAGFGADPPPPVDSSGASIDHLVQAISSFAPASSSSLGPVATVDNQLSQSNSLLGTPHAH